MENQIEPATDMELALSWGFEIQHPCWAIVDGRRVDMRESYINYSREQILPILTNPFARKYLEGVITSCI